jgi:Secretion system C-terminal sorting domain
MATSGLASARFIKIVDDGDGIANQANAGFDLDAIEAYDIVPVELLSFTAENINGELVLKWQTATETNNMGFEILRFAQNDNDKWETIGYVPGFGTTTEPKSYSFADDNISSGIYTYRLKQIDFDGTFEYSQEIEVEVSSPTEFSLEQNYPNPFNPSTTIKFSLPEKTNLIISVYNLIGEKVEEVFSGELESGYHEVNFNASLLASGVYLYQLQAQDYISVKKMLLLK